MSVVNFENFPAPGLADSLPACSVLILIAGARLEFWGGGVTVMEKREILLGWVTKVCLKCTKKLG